MRRFVAVLLLFCLSFLIVLLREALVCGVSWLLAVGALDRSLHEVQLSILTGCHGLNMSRIASHDAVEVHRWSDDPIIDVLGDH